MVCLINVCAYLHKCEISFLTITDNLKIKTTGPISITVIPIDSLKLESVFATKVQNILILSTYLVISNIFNPSVCCNNTIQ